MMDAEKLKRLQGQDIEDLLDQWEVAMEQGQDISVQQLCVDHPELLVEVGNQIAALKGFNRFVQEKPQVKPKGQKQKDRHSMDESSASDSGDRVPDAVSSNSGWDFRGVRVEQDPCGIKGGTLKTSVNTKVYNFYRKGGGGAIYRGEDAELGRQQAIKVILLDHACDEELQRRFENEARVTARLEHPGIIPVYGMGETEDGLPFYSMRFVEDSCLDDAILQFHKNSNRVNLSVPIFRDLLQRFVSVCQTIAYAHNRGIVHRDIKPHNVLLGRFGETLVIDWGLARPFKREGDFKVSNEKTLVINERPEDVRVSHRSGTLAYMSPQQHSGLSPSPSDDIYSLGATLYKILCGKSPVDSFAEKSEHEVRSAITEGRLEPPERAGVRIPAPLEAICLRAMKLEARHRYKTASDLAEDVSRFLAGEAVSAYREPWLGRGVRWLGRHLRLTQILAGASLALLIFWTFTSLFFANLAAERQNARQANLIASSENFSRLLSDEMDLRIRVLETEARSGELQRLMQRLNTELQDRQVPELTPQEVLQHCSDLQTWLVRVGQQYDGTGGQQALVFNSVCLFNKQGYQVARYGTDYHTKQKYLPAEWAAQSDPDQVRKQLSLLCNTLPGATLDNPVQATLFQALSQHPDMQLGTQTVGRNYSFRAYFHGRSEDADPTQSLENPQPHRESFFISPVYKSQSSSTYNFQITVPIYAASELGNDLPQPELLGLIGMALEIGKLGLPSNGMVVSANEIKLGPKSSTEFDPGTETEHSVQGLVLHHWRQSQTQIQSNSHSQIQAPPSGNGAGSDHADSVPEVLVLDAVDLRKITMILDEIATDSESSATASHPNSAQPNAGDRAAANVHARLLPFSILDPISHQREKALRVVSPLLIQSRISGPKQTAYNTGWFLITEESE